MQAKQRYRKGADYERKLVNEARKAGKIALRSAGSHSPVDVVIICSKTGHIELIQAKAGKSMAESTKRLLERKGAYLNGTYEVEFKVI